MLVFSRAVGQGEKGFYRPDLKMTIDNAPKVYEEIRRETGKRVRDWPEVVEPMTEQEIREGKRRGGGNGLYLPFQRLIKLNPSLSAENLFLNFIHENVHHALPGAKESKVEAISSRIFNRLADGYVAAEPKPKLPRGLLRRSIRAEARKAMGR